MSEKSVEYYLSKGLDRKLAEYYASGRRKIVGVQPMRCFSLIIDFDNGERRILDVLPLLQKGTVFEPFTEYDNFKRVYVDDQHCIAWDIDPSVDSNVVWNNKVDLCPDTCYVDSTPYNRASFLSPLHKNKHLSKESPCAKKEIRP